MQIYEKRNDKREIRCHYCWNMGHNKRHCPHLKQHYEANKDWDRLSPTQPVGVTASMFPSSNLLNPDAVAVRQFRAHFEYAKSVHSPKVSAPRKRKKSRCGFCGSTRHNRRNCNNMKNFLKDLEATERAYRSIVYETLIDGMGFGLGAFVEVSDISAAGQVMSTKNSLVTSLDLDSISIGNRQTRWSEYRTDLSFGLGGEKNNPWRWQDGDFARGLGELYSIPSHFIHNGYGELITKMIAPAPSKPSKEWFLGQSPAFGWVVKKKKLSDLFWIYGSTMKEYHPNGENIYKKWEKKCKSK